MLSNEQNGGKKYRAYTTTSTKLWRRGERKNEEEEEVEVVVCLQHAVFSVHIDNNVLAVSRTLDQLKSNSTIAILFYDSNSFGVFSIRQFPWNANNVKPLNVGNLIAFISDLFGVIILRKTPFRRNNSILIQWTRARIE